MSKYCIACQWALASALLIALAGCGSSSGGSSNDGKPPTQPSKPNPTPSATPKSDLTISAEQLAKDYLTAPDEAAKKYKDKAVRIDGKVRKVTKDSLGVIILELDGVEGMFVSCGIPADAAATANALKPGQAVTVVGNCYGKLDNRVSVDSCEFIK